MAIIQSNDSELNEDLTLGPGKRLKEVRIARNLGIEDVATRLRLHVRTIKSIEADDYVALPAPTFVRGYLRGYARLLDLPCGPIVESYSRNDFAPPPLVPNISKREEIKSTDFPVRLVTYAIAGALIIFVAIWWQNQQSSLVRRDAETAFAPLTTDGPTESPDVAIAEPLQDATPEPDGEDGVITQSADETGEMGVTPDSSFAGTDDNVRDTSVDTLPPDTEVGSEVEPVELSSSNSEPGAVDEGAVAVEAVATEPGVNHLKMEFSDESWVEIYGKNEKKLFYNLAKPGSIIDISEPGPFRVLLGFAQGVKVEFNGTSFDVSQHTTAGIARFSLDNPEPAPAIAESQFLPPSSQQP